MALPSPPRTNPPTLLVLRFLEAHLQHGGLEQHSYDMLTQMVRMMTEMGHKLFPHSHILRENVRREVERCAECILEGCEHFCAHLRLRVAQAEVANDWLPLLDDVSDDILYERMREWRETLESLHIPTENDRRMYRHISDYYNDHLYLPFLALHQSEPEHPAWCLNQHLSAVNLALEDMHQLCCTADDLVRSLGIEYKEAKGKLKRGLPNLEKVKSQDSRQELSPIEETKEPVYQPRPRHLSSKKPALTANSFSAAEEQVAHRDRCGGATESISSYTTEPEDKDNGVVQPRPLYASRVPRVFTGSFEQLETDLRNLSFDTVRSQDEISEGPIKIKDFAIPSPRMLPSPATLLERREATKTQEVEWEDRLINGKVFRSRRPSTRGRSQTVDDRNALHIWLDQERAPQSPQTSGTRVSMLQRKNTM